jgi:hypothetical protein
MLARPLIVWAHGGSFLTGSKADIDVVSLCQHFAKRGYVCASIDYRVGMGFPLDSIAATRAVYRAVQDMKAAIRFFRKDAANANVYAIDPNLIYAGGSSAGAFTALHLAYLNEYSELPAAIDTSLLGDMEGNSGNPGYSSTVNAVVNLCGALGKASWIKPGDIPFVSMHGTNDNTVPYATAVIYLAGVFPIMLIDGSYSVARYADSIGVYNQMYTYFGSDHVPYATNLQYMDTTVRFVSNFLYTQLGCTPSDPNPLPNTFTTGIAENNLKNFMIYPNPSSEKISVQSDQFFDRMDISDLTGRVVLSANNSGTIDVAGLGKGIYLVRLFRKNQMLTSVKFAKD